MRRALFRGRFWIEWAALALVLSLPAAVAHGQGPRPRVRDIFLEAQYSEEADSAPSVAVREPAPQINCWAPSPTVWFRSEFLYWWTKSSPLPVPLVSIGSPADAIPGAIGQPGTSVLIGNEDLDLHGRAGGRFTLGGWIDDQQDLGLEATYVFLGRNFASRSAFSDGLAGSAALTIPFYDPTLPGENVTSLSRPGSFSGDAVLHLTEFFQGAEVNLFSRVDSGGDVRFDLLGGFRWVNVTERLTFSTSSPNVYPNVANVFDTFDGFRARNNFYGGQIGLRTSYDGPQVYWNATGKVALGGTVESVAVRGKTFTNVFTGDGTVVSYHGAYLSQPTNIGNARHTQFAVVPEVNLNLGYKLRPWASVFVGYSFLYVSSVARPGDQIDRVINPTQAPAISGAAPGALVGPPRPALGVHDSDFWVQGINVGLDLRF